MKKRMLSLLLTFSLLISCLPLQAGAQERTEAFLEDEIRQRNFFLSQKLDSQREHGGLREAGDAADRLVSYIQKNGTLDSDGSKYVDITIFVEGKRLVARFIYYAQKNTVQFFALNEISYTTSVGSLFDYNLRTRNADRDTMTAAVLEGNRNYGGVCTSFHIGSYTPTTQLYFTPVKITNSSSLQKLCNSISHLSMMAWELAFKKMALGISMYDLGFIRYFKAPAPDPTPDPDPDPNPTGFTDVKADDYFYDAVEWAVENEITAGTEKGKFSPNTSCNRAQAVTFLWRAAGSPTPQSTENPFTDVSPDQYYYQAVLWAVENEITLGTSSTQFSPKKICNRGQIVTFLHRSMGSPWVEGESAFGDVEPEAYYYQPVQWAVRENITLGTGKDTFSPGKNCTRGQIVTFLYRSRKPSAEASETFFRKGIDKFLLL